IPQPIPDGGGVAALSDGKIKEISAYKEYLGTCLTEPLQSGVPYKFQFQLGISPELKVLPMNVSLFAAADCNQLPFGGGSDTIGCPTNEPNWVLLGGARAVTLPGWHKMEIEFTPTSDLYAIAIGPPCTLNDWRDTTASAFYFLDELYLAKAYNFNFEIEINDHPCSENLQFEVPYFENLRYQWYKDGIALLNETSNLLQDISGQGVYQVSIDDETICFLSEGLDYADTVLYVDLLDTLCMGKPFVFQGQYLTTPGQYFDTLKTANNCDSILRLTLIEAVAIERGVQAKIFPSETYIYEGRLFSEPGDYRFSVTSSSGCEEFINLSLEHYAVYIPEAFSPNGDGVNDLFVCYGSDDLNLIASMRIFDRWGAQVYQGENLLPNDSRDAWDGTNGSLRVEQGVYVYVAELVLKDGEARVVTGSVVVLP
ncbi:MAG: gliding motility-associated C-terminal domain-containing protein, partial [Bacteroidota bacterium]